MYFRRRSKRNVPEINSSSTADIAFLLLIFFLMTTSMDTDMGLPRRLPEWAADGRKPETVEVRERNVLSVRLDADDRLWCDERLVGLAELHAVAREFVGNPEGREDLPERVATEVPGLGTVEVTKNHVTHAADAFFPNLDDDPRWRVSATDGGYVVQQGEGDAGVAFEFVTYERQESGKSDEGSGGTWFDVVLDLGSTVIDHLVS